MVFRRCRGKFGVLRQRGRGDSAFGSDAYHKKAVPAPTPTVTALHIFPGTRRNIILLRLFLLLAMLRDGGGKIGFDRGHFSLINLPVIIRVIFL